MTEVLFAASVAFVGYVIYVLIDEQVKSAKTVVVRHDPEMPTVNATPPAAIASAKPPESSVVAITTKPADSGVKPTKPMPTPSPISRDVTHLVGVSAGTIWTYLKSNGPISVAKMAKELSEDNKMLQRSIGWLAQENKITLDTVGRVETIGLKD